jgi:photosystem II stability/assembly factor-like uncharacterized protein
MKNILPLLLSIAIYDAHGQWESTKGPSGGTVNDVIKVGNFLFANGYLGGIYRSADNGQTWTPVNKGLPEDLYTSDLATDGTTLYTTTSQAGIFASTDNGENWVSRSKGIETATFYSLEVSGNNIYGGYANGGLYYSPDKGVTWSFKQGVTPAEQIRDMKMVNGKLWIGTSSLYTSTDNGTTWQKQIIGLGSNGVYSIEAINNDIYLGGEGELFASKDLGATWTKSTFDYTILSIFCSDTELWTAGNSNVIHKSTTKGDTWSFRTFEQPNVSAVGIGVNKIDNSIFLSGKGVYKSSDDGITWTPLNNGIYNQLVKNVAIRGNVLFAGTDRQGILFSSDRGETWKRPDAPLSILDCDVSGFYSTAEAIFAATSKGVFKSLDNGVNWSLVLDVQINESFLSISGNGNRLVAYSNRGAFVSKDGGLNWTLTGTSIIDGNGTMTTLIKGDTVICSTSSKVFVSKNSGQSWKEASSPVPSSSNNGFFFPNDFLYANSTIYLATYQGLFKTNDLGITWTKLSAGIAGLNILDIASIGNALYVCTNNGVFASFNQGDKWYPVNGGASKFYTYSLVADNDFFYLGTYGRSVWKAAKSKIGVAPVIVGTKNIPTLKSGESFTLSLSNLTVEDPDSKFPDNFTFKINSGSSYTVSDKTIQTSQDFHGDLAVSITVSDGQFESPGFSFIMTVASPVTGLAEFNGVQVFPNPFRDFLYVKDFNFSNDYFSLLDFTGKEVKKFRANGEANFQLDTSQLPAGIYFLKGSKLNRKLLKVE